jgi:hypothetical protein
MATFWYLPVCNVIYVKWGRGIWRQLSVLVFSSDDVWHLAYVFTVWMLLLVIMRLAQQSNHFFLPKIFMIVQYEMAFISVSDPDNFMF